MSNGAPVRALAMRVTRADACGVPVAEATANSRVTTTGFINVGFGADVFRSSDIQIPAASGAICIRSKGVPSLLGGNVTLQLCDFNLAVMEMLLQTATLTDYTTPVEDVGGVLTADGSFNDSTVVLEWWSENNKNDACAAGGTNPTRPYLHFVAPRVNRWVLDGNVDFGDNATTATLSGYAEPSTAFVKTKAADEFTAADELAIQQNGLLAWREVTALPVTIANGYDA